MRIPRQNVQVGMYIERIEGDWIDNPFWRTGFVISDPGDVEKLRNSSVSAVVIDRSKSVVVGPDKASPVSAAFERPRTTVWPSPEDAHLVQTLQDCRRAVGEIFAAARSGHGLDMDQTAAVVETIARSVEKNPSTLISLTRLKTMEAYTFSHSVAVAALLMGFGRHLGFGEAEVQEIGMAGLLHDIGKVRIADAILTKTTALTEAEILEIRAHPLRGAEILSKTPDLPPVILDVCLHHHERIDGKGYPNGLSGAEITLHARIAAICDVFDALTTARPYKIAWSTERALSQMASWTGHLDADLLREFALSLGRDKLPPLVRGTRGGPYADGTAVNGYSDPSA